MRSAVAVAVLSLVCLTGLANADDGIPVKSPLVQAACGSCHATDDAGRMSRISWQRKSAEGWQITIIRMIRTGNVDLAPEDAREVVRYLTDNHGLAPEEERPYFYLAEQRPLQESFGEDEELLQATCSRCHLTARFRTQRRTGRGMGSAEGNARGVFPSHRRPDFPGRARRRALGGGPGPRPAQGEIPLRDAGLARLSRQGAGRRHRRSLVPARRSEPGGGPIGGIVEFRPDDDSGGNYGYEANLILGDGTTERRLGAGVLYGGFSFRGRSEGDQLQERRAALMLSDDGRTLTGRLFRGRFGEDGIDVTLTRSPAGVQIAAAWPPAGRAGATATGVRLIGAGFDDNAASTLDFGSGIAVENARRISEMELLVDLQIDAGAPLGYRDVSAGGIRLVDGFAVHDRVDYIRVTPEMALSRVGGAVAPKQFVQFEANGWHRGPDNERLTDDDVALGPVEVTWTTEEYYIRDEDDDTRFVGNIDADGLFTPGLDGPNPERELMADNMGDVWVVAEHEDPENGETLRGRARLVVAPPVFLYWDLFPQRAKQ